MSELSTRLALPYLASGQAQKHITVNEALGALDALICAAVLDRDLATPPADPDEGDCYIVASDADGAWSGWDEAFVIYQDGAWRELQTPNGALVLVVDEAQLVVRHEGAWVGAEALLDAVTPADAEDGALTLLGVNTGADSANRLAVKSNAVLFSHDDVTPGSGDMRLVLNKSNSTHSAELLLQDNFSGRAAFGLAGGDDVTLKVSADGSVWTTALSVNRTNGAISLGKIAASDNVDVSGDTWRTSQVTVAATAAWPQFKGRRARGSLASLAAVQTGDTIFAFTPEGHDGSAYVQAGGFDFVAETSFSSAKNAYFRLATIDAGAWSEKLRVKANGNVGVGLTAPATKLDVDGPVRAKGYTVASLPSAGSIAGAMVYVSDESGGAVMAFSDGTNWRRVTDRAVVS